MANPKTTLTQLRVGHSRCFNTEQSARLAPLTLLVGDNSTGKTSFLALIRALWDLKVSQVVPNFKEPPYDLGSFDEIVHFRGGRGGRAESFEAYLASSDGVGYRAQFRQQGTVPMPVLIEYKHADAWVRIFHDAGLRKHTFELGTARGTWRLDPTSVEGTRWPFESGRDVRLHMVNLTALLLGQEITGKIPIHPLDDAPAYDSSAAAQIRPLLDVLRSRACRPYASAPIRSKPRRTYDPSTSDRDPEGDYVPIFLAELYSRDKDRWEKLKGKIEQFGKEAGLFDEIVIRRLGGPFQVWIRKGGRRLKGPLRNLIDMGYGISQILPIVAEINREDCPDLFLLQQPEANLHPSVQAALGSFFCRAVAEGNRQFIIETHSDRLMDRIRMDVRDDGTGITPEDVSILFFERDESEVRIHSLGVDTQGNILNAPRNYRAFFMQETRRSLGL